VITIPARRRAVLSLVLLVVGAAMLPLATPQAAQASYSGEPLVAFTRLAATGATTELWAARPDMSDRRRVWRSSTANAEFPQVSQDGTTVVFGVWRESPFGSSIYTVGATGTGLVRWTTPAAPWIDVRPTWAPDKSAVYFTRLNVDTGASSLFRVATAGATPTAVAGTSGADFATVSPDGRYLAFDRRGSIVLTRTTGDDAFVLRAGSTSNGYHQPRWSPDGRSLAAVHEVTGQGSSLFLLHTSDAVRYTVTSHPAGTFVGAPAWSGDSRQLYYSLLTGSESAGYAYNLRRVAALQGAQSQPVTSHPANGDWEWSPHLGGGAGPVWDRTGSPPVYGSSTVELEALTVRYAAAPAAADAARFVVRYSAGSVPPATPADGTLAYRGLRRSVRVAGLTPATTYSFSVFAVDWSGNVSPAATKTLTTARRSSFVASTSPARITFGGAATIRGLLTDRATGAVQSGKAAVLYARPTGSTTWTRVLSATTDSLGTVQVTRTPGRTTAYHWRFAGDSGHGPARSTAVTVEVRTKVTAAFKDATVPVGTAAYLVGSVAPGHAGKTVYLQRYYGGAWHSLKSARLSSTSRYSFSVRPSRAGKFRYRVVKPADTDHLRGISPERILTVS
jgi:Tol biopolymer transport system component